MKSYFRPVIFSTLLLLIILTACAPAAELKPPSVSTVPLTPTMSPTAIDIRPTIVPPTPQYPPEVVKNDLTQVDEQGGIVVVSVTPLNLDQQADTINFDISLETHSVDLSMDLAELSTLTTDTGKSIKPTIWDAPMGGHHVAGTLIFPSLSNGISVLDAAKRITLTIKDVAVPERIFIWELTGAN